MWKQLEKNFSLSQRTETLISLPVSPLPFILSLFLPLFPWFKAELSPSLHLALPFLHICSY